MVAMVPQTDLLLIAIPCIVVIAILIFYIVSIKINSPEAFIFRAARAKKRDVRVEVDIATGRGRFILCKPEDGDDQAPTWEQDGPGVHVRPDFCQGHVDPININDIRWFFYGTSASHPLGTKSAMAFETMRRHRTNKRIYKQLDFLPDKSLFSLMRVPEEDLPAACHLFIQEYNPEVFDHGN
jgi:hypothetical protein